MAEPNPSNVAPWYLRNINQALELDPITGNVFMRTGIQGNVYITGPVTVPAGITITSGNSNVSVVGNIAGITALPPITGNVNANVTGGNSNVTVVGNIAGITTLPPITGNVAVTQATTPWSVTGNITSTPSQGSTDAFGRLRVSEPFTLFDTKSRYYDHDQFSSSTLTGGTVTYVQAESSYNLSVTAASGSSVIRETKRVFIYQPGKSQLTLNTFCMATPITNVRQRVGLFGANDGVFFENDGTYNYMVIRSSSTGVIVEDRVRQDAWNGDRLNSAVVTPTCPSGQILYPDRTQIFYADVEWLGVGDVRTGFVINGQYILCHTFHHANQPGNTRVYMTTATLPIRYEITNTGAAASSSVMKQICSTVISEGGFQERATTQAAGTGVTPFRLASSGTFYPLVSIRLASSRLDAVVIPTQVDILSPTVNYYQWALLLNPTLTGATWTGVSSSGTVQYDTAARVNAVTGGTLLQSGYASSRELSNLGSINFDFQLGRTLAGVSDVVTLALTATSNNADVLAQLGWEELS